MQITNSWVQPQIPQNKSSTSAASTMDFLNTAASGAASNDSPTTNSGQSDISGASPAANFSAVLAAASVNMASGNSVPVSSWLTASDVKLIQETTGQTIDPPTGNAYDANGQKVILSQAAGSLVNTLSTIRQFGVPDSNGSMTMVSGAITAADLQTEMQFYAGNPEGLTHTNNFAVITQAISVLSGTTANKATA